MLRPAARAKTPAQERDQRLRSVSIFEILPRDQAPGIEQGPEIEKTLRVVSTVEYYLQH